MLSRPLPTRVVLIKNWVISEEKPVSIRIVLVASRFLLYFEPPFCFEEVRSVFAL